MTRILTAATLVVMGLGALAVDHDETPLGLRVSRLELRMDALEAALTDARCFQLDRRWRGASHRFCLPAGWGPSTANGWQFIEAEGDHLTLRGKGPSTAHDELSATIKLLRQIDDWSYRRDRHALSLSVSHEHFNGRYPRTHETGWFYQDGFDNITLAEAQRIAAAFVTTFKIANGATNLLCSKPVGDVTHPTISGVTETVVHLPVGGASHVTTTVADMVTFTLPSDSRGPLCR